MVKTCLQCRRPGSYPWVGNTPWRRAWQPTLVFLPGESRGQWSLGGYSPWGHKETDMAERLTLSLSCFWHHMESGTIWASTGGVNPPGVRGHLCIS